MRFYKHSRKGSTMIPAVFLLLFILIFGAALVRGVLLSANFSNQTLNKRQAYLLAESATNYICDTLSGTQTEALFISIDTLLNGITINTTIDTPVTIDGHEVKTQIKLISRIENGNKTFDVYKISSAAKYGDITQRISREMTAERTKGGLGDISTTGLFNGREKARYSFVGPGSNNMGVINGSARYENSEDFICQYLKVNGDLFIRGDVGRSDGVYAFHLKVTKNLYVETTSQNPNTPITLYNVDVGGDIVVHTNGIVALSGNINATNMYIYAEKGLSYSALALSNINNLYLAPPIESNSDIDKQISGTIHTGEDAGKAVLERYRPSAVDPPLEINLPMPSEYDFTITANEEWADVDINFAEKSVFNVLVEGSNWAGEINVSGEGAVNIYSDIPANDTLILNNFRVNHALGSTAAINIICSNTKTTAYYDNPLYPLAANLIISNGTIMLRNSAVNGIGIAGAFDIYGLGGVANAPYFNFEAPWFDFGGGLPGIGKNSVKYTYGPFIE